MTAIWAPTGIALAAILLWGYRVWPGVALGALLANAWTGVPFYAVLGITVGNTLEALAGAYLLRELADFRASLDRVRDVLALAVLAGAVSTTISATIGVTSLLVGNEIASGDLGSVWRTWWLGDMGGDLVVAPALLVAATHWPYRRAPGRLPEAVALVAAVLGVSALVFSQSTALTFLVLPLLVWAALRFWQPGAVGTTLLVASIAIPLTENDIGPFSGHPPDDRLLLAQGFLGIASLTGAGARGGDHRAQAGRGGRPSTSREPSRRACSRRTCRSSPGSRPRSTSEPPAEQHLVGGDFYDLFPRDDGSWTVVVGDVLGKGATAAATTGLARYTLRAAAVSESRPSRILGLLNDAIRRQSPDQSCTVACGRLDVDGADGAQVTLSVGGHPLPLVLRADGRVEPVGQPGTMLGVLPDPELADQTAESRPRGRPGPLHRRADRRLCPRSDREARGPRGGPRVLRAAGARPRSPAGFRRRCWAPAHGEPRDDIVLLVLRVPERRARAYPR